MRRLLITRSTSSFRTALWLGAAAFVCAAAPGAAQITSVTESNGKRVFINADTPRSRRSGGLILASPRVPAAALRNNGRVHPTREDLERLADEAAARHQVDAGLVRAIIQAESSWDPDAVSWKGAQGLMQLMPARAEALGVEDPFDAEQNIEGGVRHLKALLEQYEGDVEKALAAYNAGSGAVERAGGVPNYRETIAYVRKITEAYARAGSGGRELPVRILRPMYRTVDEQGKTVFTNQ